MHGKSSADGMDKEERDTDGGSIIAEKFLRVYSGSSSSDCIIILTFC